MSENEQAAKAIEEMFAGLDVKVVDHRDEGEGIKLALNCGDAYDVAEAFNLPGAGSEAFAAESKGYAMFPDGCWMELINGECLRLLKEER